MSGDESGQKSSYFFHKSLKDILRTTSEPLFNTADYDSQGGGDSPSPSKPVRSSPASDENEPLEQNKKENLPNSSSWKEYFFFSSNDERLKDGLKFFKCINCENNQHFNDVRIKLKKSIRHKMLKRRSLAVKRKFNKRKFNRFVYKK